MGCSIPAVDIGRLQSPRPVRNDFPLHFAFHPPTPLARVGLQRITPYIHRFSGISPEMYRIYKRRYLNLWDPAHIHVRLIIRFCPCLIPKSRQRAVYNRYKVCQAQLSAVAIVNTPCSRHVLRSHATSTLNGIEMSKIQLEFKIWVRGRIEKPFHLRRYGQWALKDFPDPKYKDPVRYALAASIMEQLVDVFNWRTQRGIRRDYVQTGWEMMVGRRWDLDYPPPRLEIAPLWTKRVPPSPIPLVISSSYSGEGLSYDQVLAMYDELTNLTRTF